MNPRNTAILALVVTALGAFVWLYEIRGAEERSERAAAEKRLWKDLSAEQIFLVTLRTKDGKDARLERVEGAWKLLAPVAFPADAAAADALSEALASLTPEASFEDPAPLAEYGLEGPPRVRFRAGDRELALRVGSTSPVGANTYVATSEDKPVYAVASFRLASLERSLDDLRDKRPMRFDREAVAELQVRWKGGAVRIVRDAEQREVWRLAEPLAAAADARAVSKALSDLEFVRATDFDDAPAPALLAGLERPELEVELVTRADGKEGAARFALGAAGEGGARPARGNAAEAVYRLPAGALDDFPRSVDAWRDKELTRFVEGEARRFELAFHAESAAESLLLSGRREGEAWSTEPEAMRPEAAGQLVLELSGLDASRIAAESLGAAERAALGLDPPRVVARVFGGPEAASDGLLAEVHLGIADAARGIAAKRPDRDTIYWLPFERGEQIPTSPEALRERFLAAAPEAAAEAPPGAPEAEAPGGAAEAPPE
jgi:uncharacterized protein DUF4340